MIALLLCSMALAGQTAPGAVHIEINPGSPPGWEDSDACRKLHTMQGPLPVITAFPETADILCAALITLLDAQHPDSPAVTRTLPPAGYLARVATDTGYEWRPKPDVPREVMDLRDAGWYVLALDHAGLQEQAGRLARFLAALVQQTESAYGPRGSVAGQVFADGTPAVPFFQRDITASAFVLAALRSHADFLEDAARTTYLTEIRAALEAAAGLLADWTLGGSGEIAPAFVPTFGHDGVTPAMYFAFWMGIESARQGLELLGDDPPPAWTDRQRELMSRIKFQRINRGAPARLSWNLGQWFQRISRWPPADLGLYIANEAGVPAPEGFAWDMPAQLAHNEPDTPEPLAAATRIVAITEFLRSGPAFGVAF